MIGDCEIMIDVLLLVLLPEMSRAERAGRAKKTNNSHRPALRRRCRGGGGAIGRSSIVEGKSLVYCTFLLISCQPRLGTRPGGLGETQAVTDIKLEAMILYR